MWTVLRLAALLVGGCAIAEDFYARAREAFNKSEFEAALFWLSKLPAQDADQPAVHNLKSLALAELSRFNEALEASSRARQLDPQNANYVFNAGLILMTKGGLTEAETLFRQGLQRFPASTALYNGLGETLLKLYRFKEAEQVLLKSAEIDSRLPNAYVLLARLYYSLGEREKLGRAVQYAIQIAPDDYQACLYYGTWLIEFEERPEDGSTFVRKSIELNPRFVEGLKTWGKLLTYKHDWQEAVKVFERAYALAPRDAQTVYLLATARRKTGDRVAAEDLLRKFALLSRKEPH